MPKLPRIERPCPGCALPLPPGEYASLLCGSCLARPRWLSHTVAGFAYAQPVSTLIGRFKYRAGLQQGRVLGVLLARHLRAEYRERPLPQCLIPVPLHAARLRERGFNQALVLARYAAQELALPVAGDLVRRQRQTASQQGLSARERRRNLRGAFALSADSTLESFESIALIDDVVTTMSTAREIARVLRQRQPALEIHLWCLARA